MSKTYPLNTANPSGDSDRRDGDDYIRQLALAVKELLSVDHFASTDSSAAGDTATGLTDDDAGKHSKISFREYFTSPSIGDNDVGLMYVTSDGEVHYVDSDSNDIQLTKEGRVYLDNAYISGGGVLGPDINTTSVSIAGGTTATVDDGGSISLYGNSHATKPGQIEITAGYSSGTTKAVINVQSSRITNVVDPTSDQDAATKKYIDDIDTEINSNSVFGSTQTVFSGTSPTSYQDLNLSGFVGENKALVVLKIVPGSAQNYWFRKNGDSGEPAVGYANAGGLQVIDVPASGCGRVMVMTDASGIVEWKAGGGTSTTLYIDFWIKEPS